jgi:hypothetical protein
MHLAYTRTWLAASATWAARSLLRSLWISLSIRACNVCRTNGKHAVQLTSQEPVLLMGCQALLRLAPISPYL